MTWQPVFWPMPMYFYFPRVNMDGEISQIFGQIHPADNGLARTASFLGFFLEMFIPSFMSVGPKVLPLTPGVPEKTMRLS